MKKISALMVVVLIVVLSVPSVPAFADASLIPGYYTVESTSGFVDSSYLSGIYPVHNGDIDLSNLAAFSNIDFSKFDNGFGYSYWIIQSGSNKYFIYIYPLIEGDYEKPVLGISSTGAGDGFRIGAVAPTNSERYVYYYSVEIGNNYQLSTELNTRLGRFEVPGLKPYYYGSFPPSSVSAGTNKLIYAYNIYYVYSLDQSDTLNIQMDYPGIRVISDIFDNTYGYNLTNFWSESLPYYDGEKIVDPDGGGSELESNLNHMYFKSCEIGFAEPSGVNSYNSFGGAYFYIKYSVDDWVRTHINDYDLYFSSTALVGSRQVNGSKRVSLDSDGCICIPFSDIFSGNSSLLTEGFVVATSNSRIEQNFYKSYLYSVSSDKLPSLVGKFSSVDNNTLSGAWDNLLDVYFGNWLLAYTSSGFTNVITDSTMAAIQSVITYYANFKIQTQCYLIDNNDNRSGSVGRIFDLATGSDTSTDNEGLTNDNPFVDDSTSDDYLPDIPTENNNYPVSSGQNGTYIQNNLSIPSQYTVTYRDGVNEFIDWYNQDTEVSGIQNTVWGSFGVFRDNPAIDLYEEYFGFLPAPFKAVIFGCGTIGIVGGAACVLRKRLMK